MIDLAALERALAPIHKLGKEEFPLTVAGTELVLVPLDPDAERLVQGWSREALQDERGKEKKDNSHVEMLEYLDRFKLGVLSYALVQIGTIDLRGVNYIATGEKLEDGTPVKKQRHLVLRELLERQFSRPVLLSVFKAYGDLMARVEMNTEQAVKYDMVDLDTEITRIKERLVELEQLKVKQEKPAKDTLSNNIKTAVEHTNQTQAITRSLASTPPAQQNRVVEPEEEGDDPVEPPRQEVPVAVQQARERSGPRQSSIPQSAPAPNRSAPEPEPEPEPEPAPAPREPQVMDSFADPTQEAVDAENRRLLAARKQQRAENELAVTPARRRREPPHRSAANVEDAVLDSGGGQLQRARRVGTVDGKEAYRLPGTELSSRGGGPTRPDPKEAQINEGSGGGEINKKFVPRR